MTFMPPRVTDRALIDLLRRAGFDVEGFREAVSSSLARSQAAAEAIGSREHLISVDGVSFVMRDGVAMRALDSSYARRRFPEVFGEP